MGDRTGQKSKEASVSVVIRTYNRASTLGRAIQSVLAQDYDSWELIVVDDGSTDNTRKILEPYESRLRYHYQENQGLAAGREKGLQLAQGEFLIYLDSDDWWEPQLLSRMMAAILRTGAGFAFSEWHYPSGSKANTHLLVENPIFNELNPVRDSEDSFLLPEADTRHLVIRHHHIPPSGVILRRSLISMEFNLIARVADDWTVILDIVLNHGVSSVFFHSPLWFKDVDGSNIYDGSSNGRRAIEFVLRDLLWMTSTFEPLLTPPEKSILRKRIAKIYLDRAYAREKCASERLRGVWDCVQSFQTAPNRAALLEPLKLFLRR